MGVEKPGRDAQTVQFHNRVRFLRQIRADGDDPVVFDEDVAHVGKRVVAHRLQLAVGKFGLVQGTVVATHITELSHVVIIGIDIRFKVGLRGQLIHVNTIQLIVESQRGTLLPHQVICDGAIEDGLHQR